MKAYSTEPFHNGLQTLFEDKLDSLNEATPHHSNSNHTFQTGSYLKYVIECTVGQKRTAG